MSSERTFIRSILNELDATGEKMIEAQRMRFEQLADYYTENYLTPARYIAGRKVSGMRSASSQRHLLKPLHAHFGARLIRSISTGDVERFKRARFNAPVVRGTDEVGKPIERQRAVADFTVAP